MAKARANCTCATCGKQFEVTAYRANSREARSFEAWAEKHIDECDDCKAKRIEAERAEANAAAAQEANEMGWPELVGTEKQVNWANTIRRERINGIAAGVKDEYAELFSVVVDELLREKTSASWWIDNRDGSTIKQTIVDKMKYRLERPEQTKAKEAERNAERDAQNDAATIAQPADRKHDGVVDIRASEGKVLVEYAKDDSFRELVKALGYGWNRALGKWALDITFKTGTATERAAELGNRLLNAGFAIRIQDADTLRNAIEGNYQPMTHRWISKDAEGRFFVSWARDDDFYDRARKLPGAKYERPGIAVPAKEYEAIRDFAHTYDFRLSPGASELMDEMVAATRVVVPAEAVRPEYHEHPVSDILNTSRDVLDDLRDE